VTAPTPLVSIAIPTYNRLPQLQRSVASALAQTHASIEVVISDNASTDATEAWASELSARDERVTYLRNPVNVGAVRNFTLAMQATRGEWFMWLADDDFLDPDYVEACLRVHEAHPGCALVSGATDYYDGEVLDHRGVVVDATDPRPAKRVAAYYRQVFDNGTYYGLMPHSVIAATTPPTNHVGADWLLLAEIAALGAIRTTTETSAHREVLPDRTFVDLARSAGFSRFEGHLPYVAIAGFAVRDIAFGSAVHRRIGWRRFPLAVQVAAIIFRRFVITGLRWRSLRRRARSIAARLPRRSGGSAPAGSSTTRSTTSTSTDTET
jgi:glycosyltransferase involved in cell wall biosynthesis